MDVSQVAAWRYLFRNDNDSIIDIRECPNLAALVDIPPPDGAATVEVQAKDLGDVWETVNIAACHA